MSSIATSTRYSCEHYLGALITVQNQTNRRPALSVGRAQRLASSLRNRLARRTEVPGASAAQRYEQFDHINEQRADFGMTGDPIRGGRTCLDRNRRVLSGTLIRLVFWTIFSVIFRLSLSHAAGPHGQQHRQIRLAIGHWEPCEADSQCSPGARLR